MSTAEHPAPGAFFQHLIVQQPHVHEDVEPTGPRRPRWATDATVAAVEAGGGKVTMAPQDTPYGRFAVVEDPWGAPFSVMQDTSG